MRKRKLKSWVKVTLLLIVGAAFGIIVYQLFTIETVHTTPLGNYTCRGGIIKVCNSSKSVANHLGV